MVNYLSASGKVLRTTAASSKFYFGTTASEVLVGTDHDDTILSNGGPDTMIGGKGDDIYVVYAKKDRVVENAGEGNDTVIAYTNYILGDHVENLKIEGGSTWYGQGNALDNIITAASAKQTIDGGAGDDILIGSTETTFVIRAGNGSDAIHNWNATDKVRLYGYGMTSFDKVRAAASQQGADAVLRFNNGETLVIASTDVSSLAASQFSLEVDTSKMKLTFGDEFDSLSLWNKNKGTWWTEYGYGWGPGTVSSRVLNNESQIYMEAGFNGDSKVALNIDPFTLKDGVVTITAAPTPTAALPYLDNRTYTSGLLSSKQTFSQLYGYFEIKAQMPAGQGFWPAFWLLPANNTWPPEIDVFEQLGNDPTTIYSTTHYVEDGKHLQTADKTFVDTTQWHTYGVNWTPDYLIYTVDGVEVSRQATPKSFNGEMFLLANLAVGGDWSGAPDATTGTGEMKIDYIHAYQTEYTVSSTSYGVQTVYEKPSIAPTVVAPPPINRAPVVIVGAAAATEDAALVVAAANGVLKGATDADGDALTATLETGAAHGTVTLAADGSFTYTPEANYNGTDSFTFVAKDAAGATSAVTTFTLNVAAVNDGPKAVNDAGFSTAHGTALTIGGAKLLANDTDVDGDTLSIASVGGAAHGSVALKNGDVVFTPDAGYSGAATFTYTVSDGHGGTASATVSLDVAAAPVVAPVAPTLPPVSIYLYGSNTADVIDKSLSTNAWMIAGAGGNDVLTGSVFNDSLNGGADNDILNGGAGNDVLTGGAGVDVITGGAGVDTFMIRPGDLMKSGPLDQILDFDGAGVVGGDNIRFTGFSATATLTLVGQVGTMFQYHVEDGAASGDLLLNTGKLTVGDYGFYAY